MKKQNFNAGKWMLAIDNSNENHKFIEGVAEDILNNLPTQNFNNVLGELNIPQFSFFINTRQESIGGINNG